MKVAIITDTHWGIRNDNSAFYDYKKKFLDDVFFPYLDKHKIDTVFHLGDLVDKQKSVSFATSNRMKTDFLVQLERRAINTHIIVGNHDIPYKNTLQVNALKELVAGKYARIKVYSQPTEVNIDGLGILLLPWICKDNYDESFAKIKATSAQVCFGHLELAGFAMYRGLLNEHGVDPANFDKFDVVCTGHFHTKSSSGNIHYLGAPFEFTWNDYDDPRGFHIFDTATRELTFVQNPYSIYRKAFYDDEGTTLEDLLAQDFGQYKDCMVKLIVKNKSNQFWFESYVDAIEKQGILDLKVVDDHLHMDLVDDDETIDEAEDTLTICRKVIEASSSNDKDKERLIHFMSQLYSDAMEIERVS